MTADEGCIFCAIARGAAPAVVVDEDPETMAFMDVAPLAPGHVLVIPRRHVGPLWELDDRTAAAIMRAIVRVADAINRALRPEGMNLFHSTGAAAGQSVFHLHVHVVPRNRGDAFRPPMARAREEEPRLAETASLIRSALGQG